MAPWSEDRFASQLDIFPQGQVVAEFDGRLVGAASSLVVLWDQWPVEHTWKEITDSGTFATDDRRGRDGAHDLALRTDGARGGRHSRTYPRAWPPADCEAARVAPQVLYRRS